MSHTEQIYVYPPTLMASAGSVQNVVDTLDPPTAKPAAVCPGSRGVPIAIRSPSVLMYQCLTG